MKKHLVKMMWMMAILTVSIAILSLLSYRKALRVEADVLKPCLDPSMSYKRAVRFGVFNPFVAILPHWKITYFEIPTNMDYATPSITVSLFGGVDGESKEVAMRLVNKGYRDTY